MSECGSKSQCKTVRCPCKKDGDDCGKNCLKCKCNSKICSNKNSFQNDSYHSDDDDDGNDNVPNIQKMPTTSGKSVLSIAQANAISGYPRISTKEIPKEKSKTHKVNLTTANYSDEEEEKTYGLNFNDLASVITQSLRVPVTKKKDSVFSRRNNKDIYTNSKKDEVTNPQVDHIVEDQILGHAVANALKGNQSYQSYIKPLQNALNPDNCDNYNVTFQNVNVSKGAIIKSYLRDNMNRGYPIRSIIKPETHFGKNMELIFQAMNQTYPIVATYIEDGRRSDGHVTGGPSFSRISDELIKSFEEMDLDLESGRKLRTRKTAY